MNLSNSSGTNPRAAIPQSINEPTIGIANGGTLFIRDMTPLFFLCVCNPKARLLMVVSVDSMLMLGLMLPSFFLCFVASVFGWVIGFCVSSCFPFVGELVWMVGDGVAVDVVASAVPVSFFSFPDPEAVFVPVVAVFLTVISTSGRPGDLRFRR